MAGLLLLSTAPNWFSVNTRRSHGFDGDCLVIDDTAVADVTYRLTIEEIGDKVYARETQPGEKLPRACFNRHIMRQGHFCLGLGYGSIVQDAETAKLWWESLTEFLKLQGIATSTGRWPRNIELDHGEAGLYHRRALDAAAALGISEDYELALLGGPSWITDRWRLTPDGKRLRNLRAPCPRGCTKRGRARLRIDCCNGSAVVSLITNERHREVALKRFWQEVEAAGDIECCGTMISCPLKKQHGGADARSISW